MKDYINDINLPLRKTLYDELMNALNETKSEVGTDISIEKMIFPSDIEKLYIEAKVEKIRADTEKSYFRTEMIYKDVSRIRDEKINEILDITDEQINDKNN